MAGKFYTQISTTGREYVDTIRMHARRRLAQRYGLNYTDKIRADIIRVIKAEESIILKGTHKSRKKHKVTIKVRGIPDPVTFVVVYDMYYDEILTFLFDRG